MAPATCVVARSASASLLDAGTTMAGNAPPDRPLPPLVGLVCQGLTAALQVLVGVGSGSLQVSRVHRGEPGQPAATEWVAVRWTRLGARWPASLFRWARRAAAPLCLTGWVPGCWARGWGWGPARTRSQQAAGSDGRCFRRCSRPEWAHLPRAAAHRPVGWIVRPCHPNRQAGRRSPWHSPFPRAASAQDHHAPGLRSWWPCLRP